MEALTKADETMLMPLAQKMSKVFDHGEDKTVRVFICYKLGLVAQPARLLASAFINGVLHCETIVIGITNK